MSCLVQSLVREGSCYVVTERQASLVSQEEENICTTHTYEETRNTLSLSTQERTQGGGEGLTSVIQVNGELLGKLREI